MIEGDTRQEYGTSTSSSSKTEKSRHRHAVTAATAAGCKRYGWTLQQYSEAMLDQPSKAGDHARSMSPRKAINYIERVWERATELVSKQGVITSRPDAIVDLIDLRDRISNLTWRGTAGSTALRVLLAHWRAAKRAGGRVYTLSYREAAEYAGCSVRTAYLATTKRLTKWLELLDSGAGDQGSTWRLLDGDSQHRHTFRGAQPGGASQDVSEVRNGELDGAVIERLMSLDAFAHRGLGSSSLKLLAALHLRNGQTAAELTETAMVSTATAYRHLARLSEHSLVTNTCGLWELTVTASEALTGAWDGWNEVAAVIGTYGTAWRRQQAHRDQRAVWQGMVLPRIRERRMPNVTPIRGDEPPAEWVNDNHAVDPQTGEIINDLVVASDGRFILVQDDLDYDDLLVRAHEAERAYLAA
ncbi:winged helix-turn-helix domain-containing protein [Streptomyces sp. NPDC059761]|uniref:winged helix-turn-helix domain-containing protein n=1 Tax=Streptomyces sp. NPDC059761 TaxID=3346937 RepID=UPI0036573D34